jgi:hypothetical protein
MKKKFFFVVILIILIITTAVFYLIKNSNMEQQVSAEEPVDIVLNFYEEWQVAYDNKESDSEYIKSLSSASILGNDLRNKFSEIDILTSEIDPVLCQNTNPKRVSASLLYEIEDSAEVAIFPRGEGMDGQSVFKLSKYNNGWYISDISCAREELISDREFSFEKEGHILKDVPEPWDANYWHIVYRENGEVGKMAPLFFDENSICIDDVESVCDSSTFVEVKKVKVFGEMTESGVDVKRLEFIGE